MKDTIRVLLAASVAYAGLVLISLALSAGIFLVEPEPAGWHQGRLYFLMREAFLYGSIAAMIGAIPFGVGLVRYADAHARTPRDWWPRIHVGMLHALGIITGFAVVLAGLIVGARAAQGLSYASSFEPARLLLPLGALLGGFVAWFRLMSESDERPPA